MVAGLAHSSTTRYYPKADQKRPAPPPPPPPPPKVYYSHPDPFKVLFGPSAGTNPGGGGGVYESEPSSEPLNYPNLVTIGLQVQ